MSSRVMPRISISNHLKSSPRAIPSNTCCTKRRYLFPRVAALGIGRSTSNKILAECGVNPDTRVRDITDEEVKKIIDECYEKAVKILRDNEQILHKCANLLLEKEKIGRTEFEELFGVTTQSDDENEFDGVAVEGIDWGN